MLPAPRIPRQDQDSFHVQPSQAAPSGLLEGRSSWRRGEQDLSRSGNGGGGGGRPLRQRGGGGCRRPRGGGGARSGGGGGGGGGGGVHHRHTGSAGV